MKHKKSIIAIALCAALFAGLAGFLAIPRAAAGAETWSAVRFDGSYSYGETLTVPSRTVTAGNETVEASFTVTCPDGRVTREQNVRLGAVGNYVVRYYAKAGGKQYATEEKFVVNGFGYEVKNTASSAVYGTYTDLGANSTGLIVRLANKDKITFTKLIDVTKLTAADDLVKFFITPDQRGVADFNKLIFTLTDSADSSVYLKIEINRSQFSGSGRGISWCMAGGNGQDMIGYEDGKGIHKNDDIGAPVYNLSFIAQDNKGGWSGQATDVRPDVQPGTIAYDYATNSVYARAIRVSDLDDPAFYKDLWHGFPSGKARLSISAGGYSGLTANFCVMAVNGIAADELENNSFSDDEAPVISLADGYEEIPEAEVGTAYPLPAASAYDDYSGNCLTEAKVYYAYHSGSPVSIGIIGGKFVPERAGDYAVVFGAKDGFGNAAEKVIFVRAVEKIADVKITVPAETTSITLGETVEIAAPSVSGGSGKITVETAVVFENIRTVIDGNAFVPEKQGEYTVEFTATDYIGKTAKASFKFTAKAGDKPVFAQRVKLPAIYISGGTYTLPEVYANDYSSGSLAKVLCDVKVKDGNGEKTYKAGDKFTPAVKNNGDEIQIVYSAKGESLAPAYVPVIIGRNENTVYMTNYIYGKDVTASIRDENGTRYNSGIEVSANKAAEKAGWTFANALVAEGASVTLKTISGKGNYDGFEFKFADAADMDLSVSVYAKIAAKSVVANHNGKEYKLSAAIRSGGDITATYSNGKITINCDGAELTVPLEVYDDGSAFEGFASSKIFLSVNAVNCAAGAKYLVSSVCGSTLSYRNSDSVAPSFAVSGDYGGKFSKGTVYTINKAMGGDTFAPESKVTLTVYSPDGAIISDVNGKKLENVEVTREYKILLSQYGRYELDYEISEVNWVGNSRPFKPAIYVADEAAPEIEFISGGTKEAKVGDVIIMPDYKVKDNVTAEADIKVSVYVVNANGRYIKLEHGSNSIKCEYAGKYTFIVMAADAEGNTSSVKHEVIVK